MEVPDPVKRNKVKLLTRFVYSALIRWCLVTGTFLNTGNFICCVSLVTDVLAAAAG